MKYEIKSISGETELFDNYENAVIGAFKNYYEVDASSFHIENILDDEDLETNIWEFYSIKNGDRRGVTKNEIYTVEAESEDEAIKEFVKDCSAYMLESDYHIYEVFED